MTSISRRVSRLLSGKCTVPPGFTPAELRRLDPDTAKRVRALISEVAPDEPAVASESSTETAVKAPQPAPKAVSTAPAPLEPPAPKTPEKAAEAPSPACPFAGLPQGEGKGTFWRPKASKYGGLKVGPFRNQGEAKAAVKTALGVDRMPPGDFIRL